VCALLRPRAEQNFHTTPPLLCGTTKQEKPVIFFKIPRLGKLAVELKRDKPGEYRFARRVKGVWVNFKLSAEDSLVRHFAGNEKPLTTRVETEDVKGHIIVKLLATKEARVTHLLGISPDIPSRKEGDIIATSEKMKGVSVLIRRIK
jgi:hypothetical protein